MRPAATRLLCEQPWSGERTGGPAPESLSFSRERPAEGRTGQLPGSISRDLLFRAHLLGLFGFALQLALTGLFVVFLVTFAFVGRPEIRIKLVLFLCRWYQSRQQTNPTPVPCTPEPRKHTFLRKLFVVLLFFEHLVRLDAGRRFVLDQGGHARTGIGTSRPRRQVGFDVDLLFIGARLVVAGFIGSILLLVARTRGFFLGVLDRFFRLCHWRWGRLSCTASHRCRQVIGIEREQAEVGPESKAIAILVFGICITIIDSSI